MRALSSEVRKAALAVPKSFMMPATALAGLRPRHLTIENLPETLVYKGEFGTELTTFIPAIFWLCLTGGLGNRKISTYRGMRSFYFFLSDDQYSERPDRRHHFHMREAPSYLPNPDEQFGVASPFEFYPDYRQVYRNTGFRFPKPILVVNNKFNDEWSKGAINFFNVGELEEIFENLGNHFQIIYFRQGVAKLAEGYSHDHNTVLQFDERKVLDRHKNNVIIFDEFVNQYLDDLDYNTLKNMLFANTYHFVTVQGGGAHHCACFSGSVLLVFHRSGPETQFAYSDGFYRYLANPSPLTLVARNFDQINAAMPLLGRSAVIDGRVHIHPDNAGLCHALIPPSLDNPTQTAIEIYGRTMGS